MPVRTTPAVMGYGSGLAIIMSAFNYTGGKLTGYAIDPTVDEVGRKEYLRKNRRRPFEDTVEDIGEGRGTSCPHPISPDPSLVKLCLLPCPYRYLRSRLRREKGREAQGRLRLRRTSHPRLGCPLDLFFVIIPDAPTIPSTFQFQLDPLPVFAFCFVASPFILSMLLL
jgi:hypothetical protein